MGGEAELKKKGGIGALQAPMPRLEERCQALKTRDSIEHKPIIARSAKIATIFRKG